MFRFYLMFTSTKDKVILYWIFDIVLQFQTKTDFIWESDNVGFYNPVDFARHSIRLE